MEEKENCRKAEELSKRAHAIYKKVEAEYKKAYTAAFDRISKGETVDSVDALRSGMYEASSIAVVADGLSSDESMLETTKLWQETLGQVFDEKIYQELKDLEEKRNNLEERLNNLEEELKNLGVQVALDKEEEKPQEGQAVPQEGQAKPKENKITLAGIKAAVKEFSRNVLGKGK